MTFCGYNSKIGLGIRMLTEGMADAIAEKTQLLIDSGFKDASVQALQNELFELDEMAKVMADGNALAKIFTRLNDLAKEVFSNVLIEVEKNHKVDSFQLTILIGDQLDKLVKGTEDFRASIESKPEILFNRELVNKVGDWVNENSGMYFEETNRKSLL